MIKFTFCDYGLKTDLFADTNGILGGTTPYNYDKNFSVTNKSILQDEYRRRWIYSIRYV